MLFTFWSGPLSWVERLCIQSMIDAGHSLTLYSFDQIDAPHGVEVRDAREVLPRERFMVCRRTGSPALFADLFRYEGLRRGLGIWVDTDVLLLRNLNGIGDHILGLENKRHINNAVLYLPSESPALLDILEYCNQPVIVAPHWPLRKKVQQRIFAALGRHKTLEDLPWGTIGPRLVTYCARKHLMEPQPKACFYPYSWRVADIAFDPDVRVEDTFTEETRAVHLWNEKIKDLKKLPPPPGSFLARMCEKHGIHAGDPVFPPSGRASEALSTSIS